MKNFKNKKINKKKKFNGKKKQKLIWQKIGKSIMFRMMKKIKIHAIVKYFEKKKAVNKKNSFYQHFNNCIFLIKIIK